jgi:hypothetical protein
MITIFAEAPLQRFRKGASLRSFYAFRALLQQWIRTAGEVLPSLPTVDPLLSFLSPLQGIYRLSLVTSRDRVSLSCFRLSTFYSIRRRNADQSNSQTGCTSANYQRTRLVSLSANALPS